MSSSRQRLRCTNCMTKCTSSFDLNGKPYCKSCFKTSKPGTGLSSEKGIEADTKILAKSADDNKKKKHRRSKRKDDSEKKETQKVRKEKKSKKSKCESCSTETRSDNLRSVESKMFCLECFISSGKPEDVPDLNKKRRKKHRSRHGSEDDKEKKKKSNGVEAADADSEKKLKKSHRVSCYKCSGKISSKDHHFCQKCFGVGSGASKEVGSGNMVIDQNAEPGSINHQMLIQAESKRVDVIKQLEAANVEVSEICSALDRVNIDKDTVFAEKEFLKKEIAQLKIEIVKIKDESETEMSEKIIQISRLKREINSSSGEAKEINFDSASAKDNLDLLQKNDTIIGKLESEVKDYKSKINVLTEKLAESQKKIDVHSIFVDQKENELLKKTNEILGFQKKLAELENLEIVCREKGETINDLKNELSVMRLAQTEKEKQHDEIQSKFQLTSENTEKTLSEQSQELSALKITMTERENELKISKEKSNEISLKFDKLDISHKEQTEIIVKLEMECAEKSQQKELISQMETDLKEKSSRVKILETKFKASSDKGGNSNMTAVNVIDLEQKVESLEKELKQQQLSINLYKKKLADKEKALAYQENLNKVDESDSETTEDETEDESDSESGSDYSGSSNYDSDESGDDSGDESD